MSCIFFKAQGRIQHHEFGGQNYVAVQCGSVAVWHLVRGVTSQSRLRIVFFICPIVLQARTEDWEE